MPSVWGSCRQRFLCLQMGQLKHWVIYGFTKNIINFSMQLRIYIVILLTCVKSHCLRNGNRCGGCSHLIGCIICQRNWIFNSQQGVVEPGGWAPFFLLSILPLLLSLHVGFDCPPPGTSLEAGCWSGCFLAFSFPSSFPPVNRKKNKSGRRNFSC